jgi:hypothetical protein
MLYLRKMPIIRLQTIIHAPQKIVFDLSRNIDLHQVSPAQTGEKAIAGRTSGLIEQGETVTWQAKHFGVVQQLTSKITANSTINATYLCRTIMNVNFFGIQIRLPYL